VPFLHFHLTWTRCFRLLLFNENKFPCSSVMVFAPVFLQGGGGPSIVSCSCSHSHQTYKLFTKHRHHVNCGGCSAAVLHADGRRTGIAETEADSMYSTSGSLRACVSADGRPGWCRCTTGRLPGFMLVTTRDFTGEEAVITCPRACNVQLTRSTYREAEFLMRRTTCYLVDVFYFYPSEANKKSFIFTCSLCPK
jgi:hypothetical protein